MQRGKDLIRQWYRQDLAAGRSALRKPGIGKLYRDIFCEESPRELLEQQLLPKRKFDPEQRLNPGNLFV